MNTGGYVQCRGCGGWLPPGSLCGYCLQRRAGAGNVPKRRGRLIAMLACLALAVVGIALAGRFFQSARSSSLAGPSPAAAGSPTLSHQQADAVVAALGSGNARQALSALSSASSETTAVLPSGDDVGAPITQVTSENPTPVMASETGAMPDDVRNWLEHLRKIESARIALATGEVQDAAQVLLGLQSSDLNRALDEDADSQEDERRAALDRAGKVAGDMATMRQAWRTLQTAFDSVPAPAECASIQSSYDRVVGETGAMMMEVVGAMRSASDDPQAAVKALTAMQGQSKARIDVPARMSDQGVDQLCRKYGAVKWFDIQNDIGSGVMGRLGL